MLSNVDLFSHLCYLMFLHYLGKNEPQKLCLTADLLAFENLLAFEGSSYTKMAIHVQEIIFAHCT